MHSQFTRSIAIAVAFLVASPFAWACSHCIKDIMSPAEFDRRAWESSNLVFVGVVVATTSSRIDEFTLEIDYRLDVEEVFKGIADHFDQRIYTSRSVPEWESGLEQITCSETIISTGDRLLVFSDSESAIPVGSCSGTRVIEGQAAPPRAEVQETLARVERWRDDL